MERMRDLLKHSLGRSLDGMEPFERLHAAWPVVCGPALARRGELIRCVDGALEVEVEGAVWAEQFRAMQALLTHELARVAGVPLRAIHFHLRGQRRRLMDE